MARADIHRPSAIIPADYDYVGMENMKVEGFDFAAAIAERQAIQRHMTRSGGTYSTHQHGGNCHICGAAAIYTALFHHKPTNSYVRTGMDCAEKLEWDSGAGEAFRAACQDAMQRRAGKAKAQTILTKEGLSVAYDIYDGRQRADAGKEENIITDIVGKLVQYGNLSDAQINFVRKLCTAIERRDETKATREAEHAAAKPLPVSDKRVNIKGKVISIRKADPLNGLMYFKMLVQHEDGWKVWGSIPNSITPNVGDMVEFSAAVKASDKDNKFGFFSRPTKAAVL